MTIYESRYDERAELTLDGTLDGYGMFGQMICDSIEWGVVSRICAGLEL